MLQSTVQELVLPDVLDRLARLDQAVLDAIPIGIYVCDAEGRILRANSTAEELWGRKASALSPDQRFCGCHRIETLNGAIVPPEATPTALAVRDGERFRNLEARVENPDGRRWIASLTIEPLNDARGRRTGAINCFQDITIEYEHREMLTRRQKSFDLAMTASKMGTWRYTIADNICIYDENAQKLYGLTEARFLHDEAGAREKFHPDDMDTMWACVAKALDPEGEGLYNVEYRVKQRDGSWKWLSAWGYVEFEGEGKNRKAVAIAGASRDISDIVEANDSQKLLINELNHRVKNMLATVQSIAMQTQRSTPKSFSEHFEARLMALARAHDLLTQRQWAGVSLRELLRQAISPFTNGADTIIRMTGPDRMLTARAALALAMVIHELVTNAGKYGALSDLCGRVDLNWTVVQKQGCEWLCLTWTEIDGPRVRKPSRKGFGSRLIERSIEMDLSGTAELHFLPTGLKCRVSFPLDARDNATASARTQTH